MTTLRKEIIRMAYQNPDLRSDMVPLLKTAAGLSLKPGHINTKNTIWAQGLKSPKARYAPGSLAGAVEAALFFARKMQETMFVYEGNSFMQRVYRISSKPHEYLNPINNTGERVISVSPDGEVMEHDLVRN